MITYKFEDSKWYVVTPIELTDEQRQSFKDGNVTPDIKTIIDSQWQEVTTEVSNKLTIKFNTIKPIVKIGDIFKVISCFMDVKDNIYNGILNYTLNGDYQQVRF